MTRRRQSRRKATRSQSEERYSQESAERTAIVAAILLPHTNGKVRLAARRALELIDACREEADRPSIQREMIPKLYADDQLEPFLKALPKITGLNDREQATKRYREFLT